MMADGFRVTGFDGHIDQAGELNRLPPPFEVRGVRPDACGVHLSGDLIGFAEAKTKNDIDNAHTRAQLRVLGYARMQDGKNSCPLYIAIPRSCAYALDRVLIDVGLIRAKHVYRLHVPEVFLAH
ncbi:hypothetical protein R75471_01672 [Paraburkholderia domus]|nr:hypothetical protein R75471_01672 [Paraburkholderia domus]